MPRQSLVKTPMTGAERQARYRAVKDWRGGYPHPAARSDRRGRASSAGMTPSPGSSTCRPNMPPGWTPCRTINMTVRPRRPCGDRRIRSHRASGDRTAARLRP